MPDGHGADHVPDVQRAGRGGVVFEAYGVPGMMESCSKRSTCFRKRGDPGRYARWAWHRSCSRRSTCRHDGIMFETLNVFPKTWRPRPICPMGMAQIMFETFNVQGMMESCSKRSPSCHIRGDPGRDARRCAWQIMLKTLNVLDMMESCSRRSTYFRKRGDPSRYARWAWRRSCSRRSTCWA